MTKYFTIMVTHKMAKIMMNISNQDNGIRSLYYKFLITLQ